MEYVRNLDDSAGVLVTAAAQTADFTSEIIKVSGCDRFGFWFVITPVSGTTPTLDITVETSFDNGTVWIPFYPNDLNSQTAASFTQITAANTGVSKYFDRYVPREKPGRNPDADNPIPVVRLNFDLGGTTPSFTFTLAKLVLINYNAL